MKAGEFEAPVVIATLQKVYYELASSMPSDQKLKVWLLINISALCFRIGECKAGTLYFRNWKALVSQFKHQKV